jgi:peptidoglycan/xylan/chitin deacetylase (PgdA/CDA1 family)
MMLPAQIIISLHQYHFGGTFFICEFPPDFDDTTKYMNWSQIKKLNDEGFEIGNHSWKHIHVNKMNAQQFNEQLQYIEEKCKQYAIPKPVSFAYPGYDTAPSAIDRLNERGYLFARTGGSRAYDPVKDHLYLIPSFSTSGTDTAKVFNAIREAKDGKIVVFTIHGVPDYAHEWVTTPPELFKLYMKYLHDHNYKVIALRDLQKYIDVKKAIINIVPVFNKK